MKGQGIGGGKKGCLGELLTSGGVTMIPDKLIILGRDLLLTFVLLNRGVPDVETIYFVSIEQKK